MTIKETERLLDGFLEDLTSSLGFRRIGRLEYSRSMNEASGCLSFPCRVDARGFVAFTCIVAARFESISRWVYDDEEETVIALAAPIHFLRQDKSFTEWTFTGASDLEAVRSAVSNDVQNLAVPFIEKYSSLDEVRKALESPNPWDWFTLGPDRRVVVLAAIKLIDGDKLGAIKLLDEALLARKAALPKSRFEIERLRKRIDSDDWRA